MGSKPRYDLYGKRPLTGTSAVLSLGEIDLSFHGGQIVVADSRDGQPLTDSGPYQLIVPEDKRPARWVRNLVTISMESVH
jgi:hypothetical protein